MRIVSLNCGYGFDEEKSDAISRYEADILVVQECRKNEWSKFYPLSAHSDWYGSNILKCNSDYQYHQTGILFGENFYVYDGQDNGQGIGFFSNKYQFKLLNDLVFDFAFRHVIPYAVQGEGKEFTLIAFYLIGNVYELDTVHTFSNVENIHKVIEFYKNLLEKPIIVIGDFSSHEIDIVAKKLEEFNVFDCIQKIQGSIMPNHTYGTNDSEECTFVDCCFASKDLWEVASMKIGSKEDWVDTKLSKHCPVIVDFDW